MAQIQGVNNDGEILTSAYVDYGPSDYSWYPEGPSLTRQEFADECDINSIMARYDATGVVSHQNLTPAQYLDVDGIPDLASAIAFTREASASFMTLPAAVRREFDNDPVKFVSAIQNGDDALLERCRSWGILAPEEKPMEVSVSNFPAPAGKEPGDAKDGP